MSSTSRSINLAGFSTLPGSASRTLPLRILFVHSDAAKVEKCLQELRGHFNVSADVVLTQELFVGRLNSTFYDVVLAEYPWPNRPGLHVLDILHTSRRQTPCIFLTDAAQPETEAELISRARPTALPWIA